MKVLASFLGLAVAQNRWEGFDDVERNQISPDQVASVAAGQINGNIVSAYQLDNPARKYMGNGLKCWYCDERNTHDCFNTGLVVSCQGQEYFCFYHDRRQISHYFNRREKYIDHFDSQNHDLFLQRNTNEAWNLHNESFETARQRFKDKDKPATRIHVMAGCQQPQACLRQQSQNNPINIGVPFFGDVAETIGLDGPGGPVIMADQMPTSLRNTREGLCRLGRYWTYYSGKLWEYDLNAVEPQANHNIAHDPEMVLTAEREDAHQFYDERESWYNGMRPNGFPRHFHGGKGTESVCHFCCNPASSDGFYCNRRLMDQNTGAGDDGTGKNFAGAGTWHLTNNANTNSQTPDYARRADDEQLAYVDTPMRGSWDHNSNWLRDYRFHGMWRNPETQVHQNFLDMTQGRR